jgi:hypothetical protein
VQFNDSPGHFLEKLLPISLIHPHERAHPQQKGTFHWPTPGLHPPSGPSLYQKIQKIPCVGHDDSLMIVISISFTIIIRMITKSDYSEGIAAMIRGQKNGQGYLYKIIIIILLFISIFIYT